MKPLKDLKIEKSHLVNGHQFYKVKYKKTLAILWEDDEVLCMPIMRAIDINDRGNGDGNDFFLQFENLAKINNKIFQISDCPESSEDNKGPMRHIVNKNGYSRSISVRDNWGKYDTVAMWRKGGKKTGYSLKTLVEKHLLIYDFYKIEPDVKYEKCWICQAEIKGNGYVCQRCGQCQKCQCISFSHNACHLCDNGREELLKSFVPNKKRIQFKF